MTKAQALKEAVRRWGKEAWVRHFPKAPPRATQEMRDAFREWKAANPKPEPPKLGARGTNAWYGDAMLDYRALWSRWTAERDAHQSACWAGGPFQVGEGHCINGRGDTWDEAFANSEEWHPARKLAAV